MIEGWSVVALALGYVSILFALAWYADRAGRFSKAGSGRPVIYALSLAVYCTVVWLLSVCVSYWISVPRYEIAMFPALIAVWDLLARRPQWRAAAVAVSAGLFAYGAGLYATGRWLG